MNAKPSLSVIALVAVSVLSAGGARAEDGAQRGRPVQFYWENDAGALFSGSDEFYTNGNRLSVGLREYAWAIDFRERFCERFCKEIAAPVQQVSWAIGHQFYTPEKIDVSAPQPLDRPWAGWLYGAVNLQILDKDGERVQHIFEAQLGILGPGAGAKFVQTEFHRLIGDDLPTGWHNQLENEPTFSLLYTLNRRFGGPRADLILTPAFVAGTVMTYPQAGATVRLGHNITGFPVGPMAPSAAGRPERPFFEAYAFAGADARYIVHNAFLDGGFFSDGPSVDRHDTVTDLRAGLSARFGNFRGTYTFVRRGEEFTPAPPRTEGRHDFGSFVVAWEPALD